jgi:adenylosuccinate synthase
LDRERVIVSPYATVILASDKESERAAGLVVKIGSTESGTGAALVRRIGRHSSDAILAGTHPALKSYLGDTGAFMRDTLNKKGRIVIEGSQGYGLSLLHGGYYPNATSRDTTAATFLGEAGLSPRDVDDITLVIRCHPIRVAGQSGPLKGETTWAQIARVAGLPDDYCELTTSTKKVRRVGAFDREVVCRAIEANNPSRIVLNHFDYIDSGVRDHIFNVRALEFLNNVESAIGKQISWIGTGPARLIERSEIGIRIGQLISK